MNGLSRVSCFVMREKGCRAPADLRQVSDGLHGRQRAAKTAMIEGSGAAQISGSAKSHLTRDPDKRDEALKKAMIGQKNAEPRRVVAGHDGTLLRTDCINDGEACIWAIEL